MLIHSQVKNVSFFGRLFSTGNGQTTFDCNLSDNRRFDYRVLVDDPDVIITHSKNALAQAQ